MIRLEQVMYRSISFIIHCFYNKLNLEMSGFTGILVTFLLKRGTNYLCRAYLKGLGILKKIN